jgi:hypothetical protein
MPPHRISVVVFLGIDSNFTTGHATSDLSVVYYPTCRSIFCPLDILKVYIAMLKIGLALEVLKFAGVDDSGPVSEAHILSRQAVQ